MTPHVALVLLLLLAAPAEARGPGRPDLFGCDVGEFVAASRAWAKETTPRHYVTTEFCEGPCWLRKQAAEMERRASIQERWRRAVESCTPEGSPR